jgi:hypothetical protein
VIARPATPIRRRPTRRHAQADRERHPVRPASDRRVPNYRHRQPQRTIGHQGEFTQEPAVRCAKVRSASRPAGHPKVAGQTTCLLMWSGRLTLPRPLRTCLVCSGLSHQGALRRFRDCARNRWPLRGSCRLLARDCRRVASRYD